MEKKLSVGRMNEMINAQRISVGNMKVKASCKT